MALMALMAVQTAGAQSTLTVSGRLNTTVEHRAVQGRSVTGVYNNASRLRVIGTEDLGGGLAAGFWLEHGFEADSGAASSASAFWNRRAQVSLAARGWGEVRLGVVTSESYFATADYVSFHNHDTGISADALYVIVARKLNKLAYTATPADGLRLDLGVSPGEGAPKAGRDVDAALWWKLPAVDLGLGCERSAVARQCALRALVPVGALTLGGYLQRDRDGKRAGLGTRSTWRLAAMWKLGAHDLHLNLGAAGAYERLPGSSARQATLAWGYALSARTRVYALHTRLADRGGLYGDVRATAVGVRHNF